MRLRSNAIVVIVIFVIFNNNGGLDRPCDAPVPFWLLLTAIIGMSAGGASAFGADPYEEVPRIVYEPDEDEIGYLAKLYYGLGMQLSSLTPAQCSELAAQQQAQQAQ